MFKHGACANTKLRNRLKLSMLNVILPGTTCSNNNNVTNLYWCKNLKVTKNAGKFHRCYVPRQCWITRYCCAYTT